MLFCFSFFFFIKNNGFPATLLHWDKKSTTYSQKHRAGIKAVHSVTKDDIIEEASAFLGSGNESYHLRMGQNSLMILS